MKILNRVFLILLALLAVIGPVALAQELPPDVVPTQEVVVAPSAPELVSDGVQVNLVQVIIGLLGAFAAGGIVGIAGLAVFVDRIRKDTATVAAMESLATSFPPSTKELLERAFTVLEKVGGLGAEVFDAVPIRDKPVLLE